MNSIFEKGHSMGSIKSMEQFLKRKKIMHSALLVLTVGCVSFYAVNGEGIKDAAAKVYINFGAATDRPASFSSILKNDFNMLVCENAMKWDGTEPTRGQFNYKGGDAVVGFADSNNMQMRGHTFVWTPQTPQWVQNLNRQEMLAAMKNHILNVGGHYKGKILEWDVVNEMIADGGSSLKSTYWRNKIGDDFIDSAFVYAHQADSNAYLYLNDYGTEGMGTKSTYLYNFVKGMKERGIPIHGVGMQCHFSAPVGKDDISKNIKRLGDLGLRVSCTEVDIQNGTNSPSSWTNVVQACVENYNATSFVVWGISDANSWRGSGCGCLLWDTQGKPKDAVISAVKNAFGGGDAAVAEKRKAFISQKPTALLNGKWKSSLLEYRAAPRFTLDGTTLSCYLPADQEVRVQVFTALGTAVIDRNLGMQPSGSHIVRLTKHNLPAGLYFAKIRSGDRFTWIPVLPKKGGAL